MRENNLVISRVRIRISKSETNSKPKCPRRRARESCRWNFGIWICLWISCFGFRICSVYFRAGPENTCLSPCLPSPFSLLPSALFPHLVTLSPCQLYSGSTPPTDGPQQFWRVTQRWRTQSVFLGGG